MVQYRWPVPILRQDIHTLEPRTKKADCLPVLQAQVNRIPWMLEDIGIGVAKLLVVLDVKVYRPIHQHLQPVLVHQAHKTLSGMRVVSSSSLWNALGHTWCQLCYRTP